MHVTLQQEYAKPVWAGVSPEAKGLIRKMLCSDAGERVSATELLGDRWVLASLKKGASMPVKANTMGSSANGGVGGIGGGVGGGGGQPVAMSPPPLRRGHTQPLPLHPPPGRAASGPLSSSGSGNGPYSARSGGSGSGNGPYSAGGLAGPKSPLRPVATGGGYRGIDGGEELMGSPTKQRVKPTRGLSLGGGGGGSTGGAGGSGGGGGRGAYRIPPPQLRKLPSFDPPAVVAVGRPASAHRAAGGPGPVKLPPGRGGDGGGGMGEGGGGGGGGGCGGGGGFDMAGGSRRGSAGGSQVSTGSTPTSPSHNASRRGSVDSTAGTGSRGSRGSRGSNE
jgi:hypothetical protein